MEHSLKRIVMWQNPTQYSCALCTKFSLHNSWIKTMISNIFTENLPWYLTFAQTFYMNTHQPLTAQMSQEISPMMFRPEFWDHLRTDWLQSLLLHVLKSQTADLHWNMNMSKAVVYIALLIYQTTHIHRHTHKTEKSQIFFLNEWFISNTDRVIFEKAKVEACHSSTPFNAVAVVVCGNGGGNGGVFFLSLCMFTKFQNCFVWEKQLFGRLSDRLPIYH